MIYPLSGLVSRAAIVTIAVIAIAGLKGENGLESKLYSGEAVEQSSTAGQVAEVDGLVDFLKKIELAPEVEHDFFFDAYLGRISLQPKGVVREEVYLGGSSGTILPAYARHYDSSGRIESIVRWDVHGELELEVLINRLEDGMVENVSWSRGQGRSVFKEVDYTYSPSGRLVSKALRYPESSYVRRANLEYSERGDLSVVRILTEAGKGDEVHVCRVAGGGDKFTVVRLEDGAEPVPFIEIVNSSDHRFEQVFLIVNGGHELLRTERRDSEGRVLMQCRHGVGGQVLSAWSYQWNPLGYGMALRQHWVLPEGRDESLWMREVRWDGRGNLVSEVRLGHFDSVMEEVYYEYDLDVHGNWVGRSERVVALDGQLAGSDDFLLRTLDYASTTGD